MKDDPYLSDLLDDAVSDVEPTDRLTAIRALTAHRSRRRWYVVTGVGLAAAAVVVAVAVVATGGGDVRIDVAAPTTTGVDEPVPTLPPGDPVGTVVYFVGPRSRLFPAYLDGYGTPLDYLMSTPQDPDYRTLWPEGSLVSYDVLPDRIVVRVDGGPVDDVLARQQLIHTLNVDPDHLLPVDVEWADGRETPIRPIAASPAFDVMSHMSITDPLEGATYGGSFTARGLSNGFEASVACFLYVGDDGGAYGPFVGQAEGWLEERLYPWQLRVDVEKERVPPGTYTLECTTDDPTGGAEGAGAATDTRTITIT